MSNKGKTRYMKRCNVWPAGWTASQDIVNLCKKNAPPGSEVKIIGTDVWAEWYADENCTYTNFFKYNEPKKDNGCDIVNNAQRWTQKCNVWPGGWVASDTVANYCDSSPSKPPGSKAKVFGTEVWAEWYEQNDCAYSDNRFVYNNPANKECIVDPKNPNVNKTRYTQQCNNWPAGWVASQDVVNLCKKNAPPGSDVKIIGTGVWAEWFKDEDCIKNTYFKFNESDKINECDFLNNRQRITKRCNVWPSGWVASNDIVDYCNQSPSKPDGSTVKQFGTEVWAEWWVNNNCTYKDGNFVYNEPTKVECIL